MKRKNQNKCYRAWVATLIIMCRNIYQIFCSITLLKHLLITNQYVTQNYCLTNSVINTLTALLQRIFTLRVFKAQTLQKIQWEDLQLSCFIKRGRNLFSVKRNLLICESKKKKKKKFCNKLSVKVTLLGEFNREKYNLNYKPHIYKSETMT